MASAAKCVAVVRVLASKLFSDLGVCSRETFIEIIRSDPDAIIDVLESEACRAAEADTASVMVNTIAMTLQVQLMHHELRSVEQELTGLRCPILPLQPLEELLWRRAGSDDRSCRHFVLQR